MQFSSPQIVRDTDQMRRIVRGWRGSGATTALVPIYQPIPKPVRNREAPCRANDRQRSSEYRPCPIDRHWQQCLRSNFRAGRDGGLDQPAHGP